MSYLVAFARFWWDFVVGDDWLTAAGLVLALGLTALVAHDDVSAWWLLPVAVVGLLLTTFGTFWGAEGAGAHWPGGDLALPVILVGLGAVSLALVRLLRRQRTALRPAEAKA